MRILKAILIVYFLISLRGLGQEVWDGNQSSQTYNQMAIALLIVGVLIMDLWPKRRVIED